MAEKGIQSARRGRKPKNPTAKPYPYDSGFETLSSVLECCWTFLPKRIGKFPFWRGEEDLFEITGGYLQRSFAFRDDDLPWRT